MSTEAHHSSATGIPSHCRDIPSHLEEDTNSGTPKVQIKEELYFVEGPVEDFTEEAEVSNYQSNCIPGLFSLYQLPEDDLKARVRIAQACKLGYDYLKISRIKRENELT